MFGWWSNPEPPQQPSQPQRNLSAISSAQRGSSMFSGMEVGVDEQSPSIINNATTGIAPSSSSNNIQGHVTHPHILQSPSLTNSVSALNIMSSLPTGHTSISASTQIASNTHQIPQSSIMMKKRRTNIPAFAQRQQTASSNPFGPSAESVTVTGQATMFEGMIANNNGMDEVEVQTAQATPFNTYLQQNSAAPTQPPMSDLLAGMHVESSRGAFALASANMLESVISLEAQQNMVDGLVDEIGSGGGLLDGMMISAGENLEMNDSNINDGGINLTSSLNKTSSPLHAISSKLDPTDPDVSLGDLKGAKDIQLWLAFHADRLKNKHISISNEVLDLHEDIRKKQSRLIEVDNFILRLENEQSLAVEKDDFERAGELDNEILALKEEKKKLDNAIQSQDEKARTLRLSLPEIAADRLNMFSKIRDRLENVLDDEVSYLDSLVESSKRALLEEESNLKLEKSRVDLARRHLQDDEDRLQTESEQIVAAMDAKVAPFTSERKELSFIQMSIEADILELQRKLEDKNGELQVVLHRVDIVDREIESVRARFARQRERIYITEARVRENKAELKVDEERLEEAATSFNNSKTQHAETVTEAASARDMCTSIIKGSEEVECFLAKELEARHQWMESLGGVPLNSAVLPVIHSMSLSQNFNNNNNVATSIHSNHNASSSIHNSPIMHGATANPELASLGIPSCPSAHNIIMTASSGSIHRTPTSRSIQYPLGSPRRPKLTTSSAVAVVSAETRLRNALQSLAELEAHFVKLHEDSITSQESISLIDSRLPLLAGEKKVAANSRNFKEAARIAALIKHMEEEHMVLEQQISSIKEDLTTTEEAIENAKTELNSAQSLLRDIKREKTKETMDLYKKYVDNLLDFSRDIIEDRISLHAKKLLATAGWADSLTAEINMILEQVVTSLSSSSENKSGVSTPLPQSSSRRMEADIWCLNVKQTLERARNALNPSVLEKQITSAEKMEQTNDYSARNLINIVNLLPEGGDGADIFIPAINLSTSETSEVHEVTTSDLASGGGDNIGKANEAECTNSSLNEEQLTKLMTELADLEAEEEQIIAKQAELDVLVENLALQEEFEQAESVQLEIEALDDKVSQVQERIVIIHQQLGEKYVDGFQVYQQKQQQKHQQCNVIHNDTNVVYKNEEHDTQEQYRQSSYIVNAEDTHANTNEQKNDHEETHLEGSMSSPNTSQLERHGVLKHDLERSRDTSDLNDNSILSNLQQQNNHRKIEPCNTSSLAISNSKNAELMASQNENVVSEMNEIVAVEKYESVSLPASPVIHNVLPRQEGLNNSLTETLPYVNRATSSQIHQYDNIATKVDMDKVDKLSDSLQEVCSFDDGNHTEGTEQTVAYISPSQNSDAQLNMISKGNGQCQQHIDGNDEILNENDTLYGLHLNTTSPKIIHNQHLMTNDNTERFFDHMNLDTHKQIEGGCNEVSNGDDENMLGGLNMFGDMTMESELLHHSIEETNLKSSISFLKMMNQNETKAGTLPAVTGGLDELDALFDDPDINAAIKGK